MTNRDDLINAFVKAFISKDKRERCLLELTNPKKRNDFINRLNHRWESIFDMRFLNKLHKSEDNPEAIQRILKFKDFDQCYVISNYGEFDDRIMHFREAFDELYTRGFGSLIISCSADRLFLDTEQSIPTSRFVGLKQTQHYSH